MKTGLIVLCLGYVLSQFFRAFLAVLASVLNRDLGVTAEDLAGASGLWFLTFALMQLPIGLALDRIGPRKSAAVLLLIGGGGGAALFALANTAFHINAAMALIGVGCSPVLMASYYIFAREYPPARFATLAALMLGIGSLGNIVASYPLALAVDLIGWRAALWSLSGMSIAIAIAIWATVQDPPPAQSDENGSLLELLKMPAMWAILPLMLVNYAPAAAIRGLWIGPYLSDVFGLDTVRIGQATLVMGVAMILGTFLYGPMDRIFKTRKWVAFVGNLSGAVAALSLAMWFDVNFWLSLVLMSVIGMAGASFPVLVAHGRSFFPPHLVGRGVTLMNLFGIGGVGLFQFASGRLYREVSEAGQTSPYAVVFAFLGAALLIGTLCYLFSRDSLD